MADENDYIPREISEKLIWGQTYATYIVTNILTLQPLTLPVATALQTAFNTMNAAVLANNAAQNTAQAAAQQQTNSITAFETQARSAAGQLQESPTVTDSQREAMGLPVRDTTRTPIPAPTTRPVGTVDISDAMQHLIGIRDEATPTSKAKPAGVVGCQVWAFVGANAPTNIDDYVFEGTATRTPFLVQYELADVGKKVWYIMRWTTARGLYGPWSLAFSATVGG